jgi:hypothetical protein
LSATFGAAVARLFSWNGLRGNNRFCSLQLRSFEHGLWHTLFPIKFVIGMTFNLLTQNEYFTTVYLTQCGLMLCWSGVTLRNHSLAAIWYIEGATIQMMWFLVNDWNEKLLSRSSKTFLSGNQECPNKAADYFTNDYCFIIA